ncbi:alpha/beta fold hydrolase [Corynebacterium mendelii]|uniref:Alpha/beta fold hydrolase n=1 Tax=Corynebacterium mendelii TaxID=2765362 RepID=A0A939E031_9CORY|nr:alpha/beta fold hydrolase [Corynebacterium mendelii]MBN9644203.1 alpha/beta fold hydrolase [Corynebacterium mendelii]
MNTDEHVFDGAATITRFGHTLRPITLTRPLNCAEGTQEEIDVFARLVTPRGGDDLPVVIKLQGGPGFPAPRPVEASGWLATLLERYRVLLLDQRGTGNSTRFDPSSPHVVGASASQLAGKLCGLRADAIVDDCEAFRDYLGLDTVSLFGQSYGGFIATTYMSLYPQSVDKVYLTGGLPAINVHVDDVYRATYAKLRQRHREFYRRIPWAEDRVREICHHLDHSDERLPDNSRLSSRRFRTIGVALGRCSGIDNLAWLLEQPFHTTGGEKRMTTAFLDSVGAAVSFAAAPLYAVVHESIYGGNVPGATAWSAERIRREVPGFEEDADPRNRSEPFYLTGEHIYPWLFEEDPSLRAFAAAADILAAKDDWSRLYNEDNLAASRATGAAAVYVDDVFVPMDHSLATADVMRDMRPWITNRFQHDGIGKDGAGIVGKLIHDVDEMV